MSHLNMSIKSFSEVMLPQMVLNCTVFELILCTKMTMDVQQNGEKNWSPKISKAWIKVKCGTLSLFKHISKPFPFIDCFSFPFFFFHDQHKTVKAQNNFNYLETKITWHSQGGERTWNFCKAGKVREFCGTWKMLEKSHGILWHLKNVREKSWNFVKFGKVREF